MAEQALRTIEELVGMWEWRDGRYTFVLPRPICDAMGLDWDDATRASR